MPKFWNFISRIWLTRHEILMQLCKRPKDLKTFRLPTSFCRKKVKKNVSSLKSHQVWKCVTYQLFPFFISWISLTKHETVMQVRKRPKHFKTYLLPTSFCTKKVKKMVSIPPCLKLKTTPPTHFKKSLKLNFGGWVGWKHYPRVPISSTIPTPPTAKKSWNKLSHPPTAEIIEIRSGL